MCKIYPLLSYFSKKFNHLTTNRRNPPFEYIQNIRIFPFDYWIFEYEYLKFDKWIYSNIQEFSFEYSNINGCFKWKKIKIRNVPLWLFVFRSVNSILQMLSIIMEQYMSLKMKEKMKWRLNILLKLFKSCPGKASSVRIRWFMYEPINIVKQQK